MLPTQVLCTPFAWHSIALTYRRMDFVWLKNLESWFYTPLRTARVTVVAFEPNFGHNSASDRARELINVSWKRIFAYFF